MERPLGLTINPVEFSVPRFLENRRTPLASRGLLTADNERNIFGRFPNLNKCTRSVFYGYRNRYFFSYAYRFAFFSRREKLILRKKELSEINLLMKEDRFQLNCESWRLITSKCCAILFVPFEETFSRRAKNVRLVRIRTPIYNTSLYNRTMNFDINRRVRNPFSVR